MGFGMGVVLTAVVAITSLSGVSKLTSSVRTLGDDSLAGMLKLSSFGFEAEAARIYLYRASISDSDKAQELFAQVSKYSKQADDALDAYGKTVTDPEDRQNFDALKAAWTEYTKKVEDTHDRYLTGTREQRVEAVETLTAPLFTPKVRPAFEKMQKWNEAYAAKVTKSSYAEASGLQREIFGVFGCALVVGIGVSLYLIRSLSQPLLKVRECLDELRDNSIKPLIGGLSALANGDLTVAVRPDAKTTGIQTKDEIGQMAQTVDEMIEASADSVKSYDDARSKLNALITTLRKNALDVSETSTSLAASAQQSGSAASEIASGSEKLARSATEAASAMEQLTNSSEVVGAKSREQTETTNATRKALDQSAQAVASVSQSADSVSDSARTGQQAVEETIAAMDRVAAQVALSSSQVKVLDEKGQQIGAIVQTIQGIAEQTNLLALNAAIEAARAGEHGRGFAVVADEVRKLADQAGIAANEISGLIADVRSTVVQTVSAIESTNVEASAGSEKSAAAGKALEQIVNASEDVANKAHVVAEITQRVTANIATLATSSVANLEAAEAMASGASGVAMTIQNVAAISEQSAAGAQELTASVEEVGAAASELSSMSRQLEELVGQFRISEQSPSLRLAA